MVDEPGVALWARIDEVDTLVHKSLSIDELTTELSCKLNHLRGAYARDKTLFSSAQVQRLRFAAAVPGLVTEFMRLLDEREYIGYREDVEELMARFIYLRDSLAECEFSKRAAKEARELREKYNNLPSRPRPLKEHGPPCPRCGAKLALRESEYGPFWGCSTYPQCNGKLSLAPAQSELLRNGN